MRLKSCGQVLLGLAITLLLLCQPSLATGYSYSTCRTCQRTSFAFEHLLQNVTDNELVNAFTKLCARDLQESNQATCKYIGDSLLPAFKIIASDNFCKNLQVCGYAPNTVSDTETVSTSPRCELCQDYVSEAKRLLLNPTVQEQLKTKALKFCQNLPSWNLECEDYVEKELKSVIKLIQKIEPNNFCRTINQCSADTKTDSKMATIQELMNPRQPMSASPIHQVLMHPSYSGAVGLALSPRCEVCDEVVSWTLKILQQNSTELAVAHALDSVCDLFYKHSALKQQHCSHLVDQYTMQLINLISHDLKPEMICHLLNFCPNSSALQLSLLPARPSTSTNALAAVRQQSAGPACFVCVQLFRYVYKHVNANQTEAEIEQSMDKGCELIFGKVSHNKKQLEVCQSLVAKNAQVLVNLIKSNAGPALTCMAVGACIGPSNRRLEAHWVEPSAHHHQHSIARHDQGQCELCESVVHQIYPKMKASDSIERSLMELSRACDHKLSEQSRSDCNVYVYKQEAALRSSIAEVSSADQVCPLMHNCAPKAKPASSVSIASVDSNAGAGCEVCKLAVGVIYKDLKENKTQASIVQFLDRLCDRYAPEAKRNQCHDYVQSYTTELIKIIESSSNPTEACTLLGYCGHRSGLSSVPLSFMPIWTQLVPYSESNRPKQPSRLHLPTASGSPACDECIKVVKPVHDWLANKKCEEDLLRDAAKLCEKCPARDNCTELLQSHIHWYFDVIDRYTEPTLVCEHIGLCDATRMTNRLSQLLVLNRLNVSTSSARDHLNASLRNWFNRHAAFLSKPEIVAPKQLGSEFCYECQLLTQYAQTLLYNASIEQRLIDVMKKQACDPMTSKIERKVCDDFLERDGPKIIQHFAQTVFNSTLICEQQLRLCPKKASQSNDRSHHSQRLVGASKCTYGPSYWCHSPENASACRATEYCAQKVWNNKQN